MKQAIVLALATVAAAAVSLVDGHAYLMQPKPRDYEKYNRDNDNSVVCGSNTVVNRVFNEYKAGETIDVRYGRNNHNLGFIRWSMVPVGQESKTNFDDNAFMYTCREAGPGCVPQTNNRDNLVTLDGLPDNTLQCGGKITLPDHLPAGDYVLQWTWFGVGGYGSESMFRSCANIRLTTNGTKAKPTCPAFQGGDRVSKARNMGNDGCWFYVQKDPSVPMISRDQDPENKRPAFGKPSAVENCKAAPVGTTPTPAPATQPAPAPQPKPALVPTPTSNKCKRQLRN